MLFDRTLYIGKTIMLFPHDSVKKWGIIRNIDDVGFIVELTKVGNSNYSHEWKVGDKYFYPHNKIDFKFIDEDNI